MAYGIFFISSVFVDGCEKTIGVHDRVFVDDKVDNALEPRGQYGLKSPSLCSVSLCFNSSNHSVHVCVVALPSGFVLRPRLL